MDSAKHPATMARAVVRWLGNPGQRLSRRVAHAVFWVSAMRLAFALLAFLKTIVVARLLAPDDFGLMGVALLMTALIENFTLSGFDRALIQRKGDIRGYLDSGWTVEVLRGAAICAILVLAAPLVAAFFDEPRAAMVVRVMALSLLIRGFLNIGVVFFQKELELHKRSILQMAESLADIVVSVGLALALRDVWALVYGALAGSAARVIASFVLHPYRPRFRVEWSKVQELFGFGKWILGSSALQYLLDSTDRLLVGRLLGTASLGLYQLAWRLSQFVSKEFTSLGRLVAFPAYAKLQDQPAKLGRVYLEGVVLAGLIALPLATGTFFLAPYLVPLLLGEKWSPMVPALQLLALVGMIESLNAGTPFLFEAIGRPGVTTKLRLARLFLLAALIYPLTVQWGLLGSALTAVLCTWITYPIGVWLVFKTVDVPAASFFKALSVLVLSTVVMTGVVVLVPRMLPGEQGILPVIGLVGLGGMMYLAMVAALDHLSGRGIRTILRQRLAIG